MCSRTEIEFHHGRALVRLAVTADPHVQRLVRIGHVGLQITNAIGGAAEIDAFIVEWRAARYRAARGDITTTDR